MIPALLSKAQYGKKVQDELDYPSVVGVNGAQYDSVSIARVGVEGCPIEHLPHPQH